MTSERMGLFEVARTALWNPWKLFEAYDAGRVQARPIVFYLGASFAVGASTGIWIAAETGKSWPVVGGAVGLLAVVLSPVQWVCEVAVIQGAARLLGGRGSVRETRAAVGLSAASQLLGFIPWLGLLLILWGYVARTIGVRTLHRLSTIRALVAALMPTLLGVCLAWGLRAVVLEAFQMPSGSMFPSLLVGDHFFVKKSAYGLFQASLPAYGEIVVFRYPDPRGPRVDYVKRVIGLPGDELVFRSGAASINGWEVPRCELGKASVTDEERTVEYHVFVEFLAGNSYLVAIDSEHDEGLQGPFRVAEDEFWVVGDNRNNSSDSRAWQGGQGAGVPTANLKGKAAWLWFPPERMGKTLHGKPELPPGMLELHEQLEKCLRQAPDLVHSTPPRPKAAL